MKLHTRLILFSFEFPLYTCSILDGTCKERGFSRLPTWSGREFYVSLAAEADMPPTTLNKPSWLLLLSSAPPKVSIDDFRAAYGPALALALRKASHFSPITLDIALVYETFIPYNGQALPTVYREFQNILALMYTLICIISTEESIDIQYDNDVDTRVVIFRTVQIADEKATGNNPGLQDHSIDLRALALSRRPWTRFLFNGGERGEAVLANFRRLRKSIDYGPQADFEELPGGSSIDKPVGPPSFHAGPSRQLLHSHYSVAVGGTFDHLHAGHKLLLTIAALLVNFRDDPQREKSITIGISGDALLQKKQYIDEMMDWNARQLSAREFLIGVLDMCQPSQRLKSSLCSSSEAGSRSVHDEFDSGLIIRYAELSDPYGPTVTDKSISALVISRETRAGGKAVNDKREANGWPPLEIFEVDVLGADGSEEENLKEKISSTDIRRKLHERRTFGACRPGGGSKAPG